MIRHLARFTALGLLVVGLQGCGEKKKEANEQPVRGLRAYKVAATAESRVRRFPSVLQPADVSSLSFEIGGQLKTVGLTVGQKVQLGDVLAEIDPRSLQSQVDQASAGVQQAQAQLDNAQSDFQRKEELLKRGVSTQAAFEQSNATLLSSRAQVDQARRQLELANQTWTGASCWPPSPRPSPGSKSNRLRKSLRGSRWPRSTATTASRCPFWSRPRLSRI
ncbi:biotin/lipoyl-binding protein [Bradyrhizobium sp. 177]|nr:biotin/lipoyl-binding protein [Bradyrhizobium sp. 177]